MKNKMYNSEKEKEKAIIVAVSINRSKVDFDRELEELESLCFTAGLEVVGQTYQNIKEETASTLLGTGKVEEIGAMVKELGADVVVVDCELTGSQMSNIADVVNAKVIDRSMLILDIFAKRATSSEGRLQVKLAQLKYSLPRVASLTRAQGRFGGGVGMRGPGETKLEMDKRVIKDNIVKLEREIAKLKSNRQLQKSERRKNRVKQVAIVGYTNAGKSTLMNTITKAGIYADDLLFATLDTTSRTLWLGENKKVVLVDTVGFIDKLPHAFIQAFNATLEETKDADLLLHVVDIADPHCKEKIDVVNGVLKEIGANNIPTIMVYNKIDKLSGPFEVPSEAICLSAKNNKGVENLKNEIEKRLFDNE